MPDAVSDTSPRQYLHQLQLLPLLPRLYGRVHIPKAVASELAAGLAQKLDLPAVHEFAWLEIHEIEIAPSLTIAVARRRRARGNLTEGREERAVD